MTSKVKVKAGSTSITGRFEINSDCSWDELRLQVSWMAWITAFGWLFVMRDIPEFLMMPINLSLITLGLEYFCV